MIQKVKKIFSIIQDWVDSFLDFLLEIPIIGLPLSIIIQLIFWIPLIIILGIGFIFVFWLIFALLFTIHPFLPIFALLVLFNIGSYCISFVWRLRKPWFFGFTLLISIATLIWAIQILF